MGMTVEEKYTKIDLLHYLREEGHSKYADLAEDIDLNLRSGNDFIAFMQPEKNRIVLNRDKIKDLSVVSMLLRHELLHFYLEHEMRLIAHVSQKKEAEEGRPFTEDEVKDIIYSNSLFNIAADYEISNRGYTEEDKKIVRNLHALVTEDDHPEWIDKDVEYMYDQLIADQPQGQQNSSGQGESGEGEGQQGQGSGSGSGSGESGDVVYGKFVDDHTFIDENGNKITF